MDRSWFSTDLFGFILKSVSELVRVNRKKVFNLWCNCRILIWTNIQSKLIGAFRPKRNLWIHPCYKRACKLEFAHCFLINFTHAKYKVEFFYQAFLNFTNSLWGKYVNQFWLPHKGRLLICGFNFRQAWTVAIISFV